MDSLTRFWRVRFNGHSYSISTQEEAVRYDYPADYIPRDESDRAIYDARQYTAGATYRPEYRPAVADAEDATCVLFRTGIGEHTTDAMIALARQNPDRTIQYDAVRYQREDDYQIEIL